MGRIRSFRLLALIALVAPCGRLAAQQQPPTPSAAPEKTGKVEISGVVVDSLHGRVLVGAEVVIVRQGSLHGLPRQLSDRRLPPALTGRRVPSCARHTRHVPGNAAVSSGARQYDLPDSRRPIRGDDHSRCVSGAEGRPGPVSGDRPRQRS